MYGLRRVDLLVCSWIMSASTIHLLNLPSDTAAANLSQGLSDLQTISMNHQFAARCIQIIRSLAKKWNIALPDNTGMRSPVGPWESPAASAFFAASIPRQDSSQGGTTSGSSISSGRQPDTPFAPPQSAQQQQGYPSFYSDPTIPMDAYQSQHAFWMPFPGQGGPNWNDMMPDLTPSSADAMQTAQWPIVWRICWTSYRPACGHRR